MKQSEKFLKIKALVYERLDLTPELKSVECSQDVLKLFFHKKVYEYHL